MNRINNMEINKKEGYILVSINPKVYALDVVYSAAYILMDKAYVLIDGDPKEEIIVELRAKGKKENLSDLAQDFNNELLNYAVYKVQAEKNKEMKKAILQRVLLTNIKIKENSEEDDYSKDPEGILKPFEENGKC